MLVSPCGIPAAIQGETFILLRSGMKFSCDVEGLVFVSCSAVCLSWQHGGSRMGKFVAKGNLYMTTIRLTFVCSSPVSLNGVDVEAVVSFCITLSKNSAYLTPWLYAHWKIHVSHLMDLLCLVCVCMQDLPIVNITEEEFKQPIFGANYLKGVVAPVRLFVMQFLSVE